MNFYGFLFLSLWAHVKFLSKKIEKVKRIDERGEKGSETKEMDLKRQFLATVDGKVW